MPEPTQAASSAAPAAPPPSAAPTSAPAAAATPPAAQSDGAAAAPAPKPSRAELRAKAIADLKTELDAERAAETKPAEGETPKPVGETPAPQAKPAEQKPADRPAAQLADIARQHRKLLDERKAFEASVAKDKETIAARKTDLEILDRIKAGEFTALEALDPQWYDKASKQIVAKMKPGDPAVVAEQIREELRKTRAELEELKNPKPKEKTPEEKAAEAEALRAQQTQFHGYVSDVVKGDTRFTALQKEEPGEVAEEIEKLVDRLWKAEGRPEATAEKIAALTERACVNLEAAVRARNELTQKGGSGTNDTAAGQPSGKSGSANPQQMSPRGTDTLTASLHEAVPVTGQRKLTREERIAAAKAQLRAAPQG